MKKLPAIMVCARPLDTPPEVIDFYKQRLTEKGYTETGVAEELVGSLGKHLTVSGYKWKDPCVKSNDE